MPLLGGANSTTPHLSDGIGLARLSASGRACTTGFPSRSQPLWFSKTAVFRKPRTKHLEKSGRNPTAGITGEDSTTQPAFRPMNRAGRVRCMPLLGGANHKPPHLSDGIGLARLSASGRAGHDGISVAEPSALVFKNGDFPEAAKKTIGNSDRNPTAGITGAGSTNQPASDRCAVLSESGACHCWVAHTVDRPI